MGFSSFWRRARQRFMQGFGMAKKTEDEIFDRGFQEAKQLKNFIKQLPPILLRISQHLGLVIRDVNIFSEAMLEAFPQGTRLRANALEFHDCLEGIPELVAALNQDIQVQAFDPVHMFLQGWPQLKEKIKNRTKYRLDYDSRRRKLAKTESKKNAKPEDISRRRGKTQMSKGQYDEWNTNCIEHMDNMIRRKYEVLDPFFINSTNSLLKFFKSFSEKLVMFEPSLERLIETQKSHDYEAQYRDEDEADVSDEETPGGPGSTPGGPSRRKSSSTSGAVGGSASGSGSSYGSAAAVASAPAASAPGSAAASSNFTPDWEDEQEDMSGGYGFEADKNEGGWDEDQISPSRSSGGARGGRGAGASLSLNSRGGSGKRGGLGMASASRRGKRGGASLGGAAQRVLLLNPTASCLPPFSPL